MSETSNLEPLDDLCQRVSNAAGDRNLSVSEHPQFVGPSFSGVSSTSTTLEANELPTKARALKLGRYTIIFGVLPDAPTLPSVRETLRLYRNQCVVARSFLSANESLDLQLFLVGPRGSEWEKRWKSLGLFLERDDRVARKLAWLRPQDPSRDNESFDEFVRRTFLARPWDRTRSDVTEDTSLDLEEPIPSGLPRNTAEEFDNIALESEEMLGEELVEALVRAWERREQS